MSYEGLDGIERNIAKLKAEFKPWFAALTMTVTDLVTVKGGVGETAHHLTDIPVECRRASPYFSGHVAVVTVPVGVASFVYMIIDLLS